MFSARLGSDRFVSFFFTSSSLNNFARSAHFGIQESSVRPSTFFGIRCDFLTPLCLRHSSAQSGQRREFLKVACCSELLAAGQPAVYLHTVSDTECRQLFLSFLHCLCNVPHDFRGLSPKGPSDTSIFLLRHRSSLLVNASEEGARCHHLLVFLGASKCGDAIFRYLCWTEPEWTRSHLARTTAG